MPTKDDLGRRLAVAHGKFCDGWMLERRFGSQVAIHSYPRQGRPRLGKDRVTSVEIAKRLLSEERMKFHLVYGRHDVSVEHQLGELPRVEVRHSHRSHSTISVQPL